MNGGRVDLPMKFSFAVSLLIHVMGFFSDL